MYNFKSNSFSNLGYISCKVPCEIKNTLENEIKIIQLNPNSRKDFRKELIGNITKEYQLLDSVDALSDFVLSASTEYINTYNYFGSLDFFSIEPQLKLTDLWINFQQKGDFNPIHDHRGMFSFVIWVKIPYNLNDEMQLYNQSAEPLSSVFSFHYLNILGMMEVLTLPVDKSWEWSMILFPSKLSHSVNPFFTSNEERISISGNVCLDI